MVFRETREESESSVERQDQLFVISPKVNIMNTTSYIRDTADRHHIRYSIGTVYVFGWHKNVIESMLSTEGGRALNDYNKLELQLFVNYFSAIIDTILDSIRLDMITIILQYSKWKVIIVTCPLKKTGTSHIGFHSNATYWPFSVSNQG